ncbi:MAG: Smr/MutS family protein [Pseudomonadota bacterium]
MRRLRAGRLAPRAELDLHGLRRQEARDVLLAFLERQDDGCQCCVRIIHGRGGREGQAPVLRPLVRQWLASHPRVLAYCPAPRNQGGSGALHVLLTRRS